jgi:invasion protein IalB
MTTRSAFTLSGALGLAAAIAAVSVSHAEQPGPNADSTARAQSDVQSEVVYSPWTKYCLKGQEATARQACFTGKDGRVEAGLAVVAAVLIEQESNPKKVLRVTLPLGTSLRPGTRVIVDNGESMTESYVKCFPVGCMADFEASDELIGRMKKGQRLIIQAINGAGKPVTFVMPLADFAKAYDGPPTDPAIFASQQEKLQEKLRKPWRDDTLQRHIFQKSIQQ